MPQPATAAPAPFPASPSRKSRITTTLYYYALFIAYGLTMAALGPTLPGLAENTGADLKAISFLFVARSAGSMMGSLWSGGLYDKLSGHRLLVAFTALMALALVLTPVVPALWLLIAITLILGLAQGAINVGGNALLVWIHGPNSGPFMNGLHFFFGIGTFIAPIIVAQSLLISGRIHWAYWILAILVLLPAPWLLRLPSPTLESRTPVQAQAKTNQADKNGWVLPVVLVSLFLFCYSGASNCFGGWIYTYALQLNLASTTGAAYLTSVFWGALTGGRLVSIPLAMRLKPATMLWADLVGSLASLGLILLFPGNPLTIWIGAAGLGFSLASLFPTTISLAGKSMAVTGKVTGWFSVGASLGSLILPLVVGQFFESSGPQVLMVVLVVDQAAAVLILAWMLRVLRKPPTPAY